MRAGSLDWRDKRPDWSDKRLGGPRSILGQPRCGHCGAGQRGANITKLRR